MTPQPSAGGSTTSPILEYYADCFARHGDTAPGAGWPNEADRLRRFDVVLDLVEYIAPAGPLRLCDLGCGSGELLRRIHDHRLDRIAYVGVDALAPPVAAARGKFPHALFHHLDVVTAGPEDIARVSCDVLVANGLFTVKRGLSNEEMWTLMTGVLRRVWPRVRQGMIFNVMSTVVDWERDDLFHVSFDRLAIFLHDLAGRTIGCRADYGLYEYMAYAMRSASRVAASGGEAAALDDVLAQGGRLLGQERWQQMHESPAVGCQEA